jgi:phosphotransferase system IIB component
MDLGDLKKDIVLFLKDNVIWIVLALAAIILISLLVFIIIYRRKKVDQIDTTASSEWLDALGGKDNIIEANATGSRLSIKLNDSSLLDEEKIKSLGVSNILKMSNKVILVLEDKADKILEKIK